MNKLVNPENHAYSNVQKNAKKTNYACARHSPLLSPRSWKNNILQKTSQLPPLHITLCVSILICIWILVVFICGVKNNNTKPNKKNE